MENLIHDLVCCPLRHLKHLFLPEVLRTVKHSVPVCNAFLIKLIISIIYLFSLRVRKFEKVTQTDQMHIYLCFIIITKQLYKEALNHTFDEPKQWEIREINEIMNQCITGWRYFPNPRMFSEYGRQKGWERENPATDSGNPSEKTMDGFVEVTEQMELPF